MEENFPALILKKLKHVYVFGMVYVNEFENQLTFSSVYWAGKRYTETELSLSKFGLFATVKRVTEVAKS